MHAKDANSRDTRPEIRLTVAELARMVGMSPRNIRAHQARGLLQPPARQGRVAYYQAGHVRRLETIKALQRQGFNLVAVQAILGARDADPTSGDLVETLDRLAAERPYLVHALLAYGVVVRAEGGTLRVVRPKALRAALDLQRAGLSAGTSVELLVEVLDQVRVFAAELVQSTGTRLVERGPDPGPSWEEYDQWALTLTDGLASLLTEAFRVAVERSGQELMAERAHVDFGLRDAVEVDIG
jgi:DNA-binding transcriptional MerR regulator